MSIKLPLSLFLSPAGHYFNQLTEAPSPGRRLPDYAIPLGLWRKGQFGRKREGERQQFLEECIPDETV